MPRYEHVLERHKSSHWPHKVVSVGAADVDVAEIDAHGTHTPSLLSWAAEELQREDGRYTYHAHWSGATAAEWWHRVAKWCAGSRSATIVSSRTSAAWALLGLWQQLESGAALIYPPDLGEQSPLEWAAARAVPPHAAENRPLSIGGLWREYERHCGFLVLSDPPLIARFRLRDSDCWLNWIGVENYGVPRLDEAIGATDAARWCAEWWRRYHDYCGEHSLGKHCSTAGSQAAYGWRYGHYFAGCVTHAHPQALSLEGASYYSGRAECYQLGPVPRPVYYCDVRSAYCYHCRRDPVPVRLRRHVAIDGPAAAASDWRPSASIGRVRVSTELAYYPYRVGDIAIWPVGTFDTVLAGPELQLAVDRGHVRHVYEYAEYECAPALSSVAQALYDWRTAAKSRGHADMELVAKAMYVSLVGQFAKRQWTWERYHDPDNDVLYGEWLGTREDGQQCRYRAIGGIVEREVSAGLAPDTMPAVAAFVCSAARVRLLQLIEIAGWDHVYYCDTDAVMVDADGRRHLHEAGVVHDSSLGSVGERWGPCDVTLRGIKWYCVDGKLVCAGVPIGSGVGDDSGDEWWKVETPKESVRRRKRPAAAMRLTGYVRDSVYRHGNVDNYGRVTPIRIG